MTSPKRRNIISLVFTCLCISKAVLMKKLWCSYFELSMETPLLMIINVKINAINVKIGQSVKTRKKIIVS